MHEIIKSVGIDIGTSTTQLIFSELTIENEASNYVVPRINIVDKKVTYRSKIYFTPLLDQKTIDAEKVKEIIEKESDYDYGIGDYDSCSRLFEFRRCQDRRRRLPVHQWKRQ